MSFRIISCAEGATLFNVIIVGLSYKVLESLDETSMKLVSAVIKPKSLTRLQSMLRKAGVPGLTVIKAQGFGTENKSTDINNLGLLTERIKIEVALEDEKVDEVVKLICDAVGTNSKQGDGIIFVWDLVSATRIEMTNPG